MIISFGAYAEQRELSDSLVRLHILANSDSDQDQELKLKVRDAVLDCCRNLPNASISDMESAAQKAVLDNGYTYPVAAEIGRFDFPRREYADFTLPAGRYTGVRITIGSGAGHNWWCVIDPPMCFSSALGSLSEEDERLLADRLSPQTQSLIKSGVEVRFRLVEWISSHLDSLNP